MNGTGRVETWQPWRPYPPASRRAGEPAVLQFAVAGRVVLQRQEARIVLVVEHEGHVVHAERFPAVEADEHVAFLEAGGGGGAARRHLDNSEAAMQLRIGLGHGVRSHGRDLDAEPLCGYLR